MTFAQDRQFPRDGDVIYFHDLHLDTAHTKSGTPVRAGVRVYEVEGKSRPMIVLYEIPNGEEGNRPRWFRVVKLSTKISDFKRKRGWMRVGVILGDKVSYADTTPYCFPANLIDGPVKHHLDRLEINLIYSLISAQRRPST
jgi:hypothetical protein